MKKALFTLATLFITIICFAQNVSFGPFISSSHSWITKIAMVKYKPGFSLGGTMVYSFNPAWGMGANLRVSFNEGVNAGFTNSTINATYLRVPLKIFHFFGHYGDKLRPKIYAGPSFGFLLGGKSTSYQSESDVKDMLEFFDFGITAGAGLNYQVEPGIWLNIDLGYFNGLVDVTKNTGSNNAFNSNRNLALNAGITFPLGTIRR